MQGHKSFHEQLEILKGRKLVINNEEKAIEILASSNYYNLINGYKTPFIKVTDGKETFLDGCTFDEIYALYDFDRKIRNIFFNSILQVENVLKTQISYVFSKYHNTQNYLCYENFETLVDVGDKKPLMERAMKIYSLLSKLQQDISNSIKHKPYIKHYVLDYGYVPMWVLVNAIPLNRLSSFYRLMNQSERIEVSKFWNVMEKDLRQYISLLAAFRNLCAHDERIYSVKDSARIPDTDIHILLNIDKNSSDNYVYGKNDLFSLMITLKKLLNKDDFNTLFNKINGRIISLSTNLHCTNIDNILEEMGFPSNWTLIKTS